MIRQIFTPLAILFLFVFSSCSKTDVTASSDDLIGTWQVTDIRSDRPYDWDGDGYTETDIFDTYSYCQQDIRLVFENGGYGQSRQGCNAPWQSLYWSLGNGRLDIDLPGDNLQLDLIQFNSTTIRGNDYVYINGQNFTITYTLNEDSQAHKSCFIAGLAVWHNS